MRPIESVFLNLHVMVNGTSTRQINANDKMSLERFEDGVMCSWVDARGGKKLNRSLWVPDDNIGSISFVPEPVMEKAEAKNEGKR